MKLHKYLSLLALPLLTACGTLAVGFESPAPALVPANAAATENARFEASAAASATAIAALFSATLAPINPPGITTLPEQPTAAAALPTPLALPATNLAPTRPPVPIVYYYFVAIAGNTFPAGSVEIVPNVLILGPTLSDIARSPEAITNIRSALQAMLNDPRNVWTSDKVGLTEITFSEGHAAVVLQGEISGAGDVVLMAARMQILMTVFAEASVDMATVTLNGENIGNLGISQASEAKPADYAYTRAEIETFMAEHVYPRP